jgi:hypothetical protein
MALTTRTTPHAPEDDPILKQAQSALGQLEQLSTNLLRRLGMPREQLAAAIARLERDPVRGRQVQQARRLVSRLMPDPSSRRVRGGMSHPALPRGLRA